MTQFARPDSDITVDSWTDEGSSFNDGNLYTSLREVSQDGDTSYVNSTGDAGTFEVKLTTVTDPEVGTGHIVHVFARGTGSGGPERLQVELYEATTLIELISSNWAPGRGSYADINFTLTLADDIADYTDLRIRITVASIGGSEQLDVTQIYLETPDAPAGAIVEFAAASSAVSSTPDVAELNLIREFLATSLAVSSTVDIVALNVIREYLATAVAVSSTSDTVTIDIIVSFLAAATASSNTPDTVVMTAIREMIATSLAASDTPDTVALNILREYAAISTATSSTPDTVPLNLIREFAAIATAASNSPDTVALLVIEEDYFPPNYDLWRSSIRTPDSHLFSSIPCV
jgi:hypothetical protein